MTSPISDNDQPVSARRIFNGKILRMILLAGILYAEGIPLHVLSLYIFPPPGMLLDGKMSYCDLNRLPEQLFESICYVVLLCWSIALDTALLKRILGPSHRLKRVAVLYMTVAVISVSSLTYGGTALTGNGYEWGWLGTKVSRIGDGTGPAPDCN